MKPILVPRNRLSIVQYNKPIQKRESIDFTKDQDLYDIIDVLKRPKNFKYPSHLEIVRLGFNSLPLFQDLESKMGKETVEPIYKELQYEFFENRQTVFNIGDMGRKFYIIMRGSVNVMVTKSGSDQKSHEDDQMKQQRRDNSKLSEEEFLEQYFPNLMKIKIIEQGESFGEIALSQLVPRTATIICREDCHFATLTRDSFNNLLSDYYKILQEQTVKFLKRVSLFAEWDETMINQISYYFELKQFTMNHVIYKEKDPANQIFIIKEGEVEISHDFGYKTRELSKDEIVIQNFSKSSSKSNLKSKRLRRAVLSQGSVFGQEEVLNNTNREQMAQCVSQIVHLFVIEKYRFINFCSKGQFIDNFKIQTKLIKNWRAQQASLKIKQLENNNYDHRLSLTIQVQSQERSHLVKSKSESEKNISTRLSITPQILDNNRIIENKSHQISNAFLKKTPQILNRVAGQRQISLYEHFQKKMHIGPTIENFQNNLGFLKEQFQTKDKFSLDSAFFPTNFSKGMLDNMLCKQYPQVISKQEKEQHKKYNNCPNYLTKIFQLPKILDDR